VLGGDPNLFAHPGDIQRFAQHRFGIARMVPLGGVKIIDTPLHGGADEFKGFFQMDALRQIVGVNIRQAHTTQT
jgi:hypothetical protein